jgi:hypothetical protein
MRKTEEDQMMEKIETDALAQVELQNFKIYF